MRTVPLYGVNAAGRVALVDDADYELAMRHRWRVQERRRPNGSVKGPYAVTHLLSVGGPNKILYLHRLLMPGVRQVDHWDGDGLNCQQSNLRDATDSQNQANQQKHHGPSSSRFKGVGWHKASGKWRARIKVDYQDRYLGVFATEEEAARAYDAAALAAWGEYARLNFPQTGLRRCGCSGG